jgi:outer membrane receptor for ferrienterochelin and colicins
MGEATPELNASFDASVVSDDRKSGFSMFGYYRNRSPFDANGDGFSELTEIENNTIGFKGFYRPSSYNKITLDFMRLDDFRRGGNDFEKLPQEADITEQVDHRINNISATFEQHFPGRPDDQLTVYISGQTVERDSYYGAEQDPTGYGFTEDFSHIVGAKYSKGFGQQIDHILTVGVENIGNDLTDKKLGANGEPNRMINDQRINTTGSFIQNESRFNNTKVLLGVRLDNYHIINGLNSEVNNQDWVFVPRINLLHDISPKLQGRLSYSQGYRAPQIFDEDLHIESSGARTIYYRNAEDLTRETSHSYTGSLSYNSSFGIIYFEALAEGFYTQLEDAFINEFGDPDENGTVIYTRTNSENGAVVTGMNFELNMTVGPRVTLQNGFTLQSSRYSEPEEEFNERSFYRTPNSYGYSLLNFEATSKLSMTFSGRYTGTMLVPHFYDDIARLEQTQSFFDAGMRVEYGFKISNSFNLNIYGGMNNIFNSYQSDFDIGVNRDPAYIYGPALPRTLFFGVRIGG